jgi:hypothetical protein
MRLKSINGAPFPEHLDFSEDTLLDGVNCVDYLTVQEHSTIGSTSDPIKWRRLAPKEARLRTGWSQPYLPRVGEGVLMAMPDMGLSTAVSEQEMTRLDTTLDLEEESSMADNDFLQHSLIFHDTLLSSQVAQDTTVDRTISSSSFLTTSFGTTMSEVSTPSKTDVPTLFLQVPPKMSLTPLRLLPSAQHLNSIYPQTPTPNLLCVLMSSPERRQVFVRRGGFKMDLCEVTVADDTMSGFRVSFWLRPPRQSNNEQSHAQQLLLNNLERIKVGDILLLRNIALTSFRDIVHGQSLNPTIARARTTIDVLTKSSGASAEQLGGRSASVIETFTRVKRWARTHIAGNDGGFKKRKITCTGQDQTGKRKCKSSLPDDTLPPDTLQAI